jgi:SAM-dependent methyltransferase
MRQDIASVFARCERVRAGLVIGFSDETLNVLKSNRPGVWMSVALEDELLFDDSQFDVVVLHPDGVNKAMIREVNRILKPDGFLFFTVNERTRKQDGFTAQEIYGIIREGFDILELKSPKWWLFGLAGRTLTVCARKKAWREHKSFIREGSLPFTPFRSRP